MSYSQLQSILEVALHLFYFYQWYMLGHIWVLAAARFLNVYYTASLLACWLAHTFFFYFCLVAACRFPWSSNKLKSKNGNSEGEKIRLHSSPSVIDQQGGGEWGIFTYCWICLLATAALSLGQWQDWRDRKTAHTHTQPEAQPAGKEGRAAL